MIEYIIPLNNIIILLCSKLKKTDRKCKQNNNLLCNHGEKQFVYTKDIKITSSLYTTT